MATALLGVVGRADDMHAILDVETAAIIGILEGWMRENGGRRRRSATPTETEGPVYAVTRHGTSRAGDPSPHDHILVGNVTYMLDAKGGYKALFSALFRDRVEAATMYGRLASAWEAVQRGYPIELDNGPVWQVAALAHRWHPAGSLRRVVEALRSDRRVPVREGLRRLPGGDVAARATREIKRGTPHNVRRLLAKPY
jgi:hypothetical protein